MISNISTGKKLSPAYKPFLVAIGIMVSLFSYGATAGNANAADTGSYIRLAQNGKAPSATSRPRPSTEMFNPSKRGKVYKVKYRGRNVEVEEINGLAILESDIVLDSMQNILDAQDRSDGIAIDGSERRWPNGVVPYKFRDDVSATVRDQVAQAISHIEGNTGIDLRPATSSDANVVQFIPADGCWSYVGRTGNATQDIGLHNLGYCGVGAAIHEIGHALGLWHEQSRCDRDTYVEVIWANIEAGREHNFNKHCDGSSDIGSYNYSSIMHYGATAFSSNGEPTIVSKPAGQQLGQRNGLNQGDIEAIQFMYNFKVSPPPAPTGMSATAQENGSVRLTWNDVSGETGYVIRRGKQNKKGDWSAEDIASTGADANTYIDNPSSGTFRYDVRAINRAGASGWSNIAEVTVEKAKGGGKGNGGKGKNK